MAPFTKKRRLALDTRQVESLTFDPSARSDYLTGFHKRKEARKQSAREAAIKRDKEEKVRERKQLRDQRKEDLESHVAAVNLELKKQNAILNGDSDDGDSDDGDEFSGFDSAPQEPVEIEQEQLPSDEEYVDEDRYTTVTVEPMGEESETEEGGKPTEEQIAAAAKAGEVKKKRPWAKDGEKKTKKKKFRYESKAERSLTRQKQKSKNRIAKARRKGD